MKTFIQKMKLIVICFAVFFLLEIPVFAESRTLGVNVFGGYSLLISSEGVRSNSVIYTDSKFTNKSTVLGGYFNYMFLEPEWAGIEISIRKYQMDLKISDNDYGTLKMLPLIVGIKLQDFPTKPGWAWHGGLGIGLSINKFEKTSYLINLEKNNADLDFNVKTSFVMDMGGGFDYFFTKKFSFTTDIRWLINEPFIKYFYGNGDTYMEATAFHIYSGLTYWFKK